MAARYFSPYHPRLSPEARQRTHEDLAIYAEEAEAALGLLGFEAPDEDAAAQLRLAVARQVNRTIVLEARGDGLGDVSAESKGDESYQYRDPPAGPLDEMAVAIVERVLRGVEPEAPPGPGTLSVPTTYAW